MYKRAIVECVPNFSEGRDMNVIRQITSEIESSDGVTVLHVDAGEAANRTVVTFVGPPEGVVEAAFRAVKKAGEVIDMRCHHGTHPRIGATDVLPLVPVCGITLEECAELARDLARRIAEEAGIPCYCYEAAALRPQFKNLAVCRAGEYEGLPEKMADPDKRPDFLPKEMVDGQCSMFNESVARTGCTVVGARDFLIAVNFNLNTTDTRIANAIAFDVREKGRPTKPGTLKCTKALGWFIDEYGIAQVSMNITNINVTPLHIAFEEVCRCAASRGVKVTGTEIIGLVPKRTLVEAGRYFLKKKGCSTDVSENDILKIAIKSMGLDELKPFDPHEKVIEFLIEA